MRAFVISDRAAQGVRLAEVAPPRVGAGELLVQMRAIGVGIHDSYYLPQNAGPLYPVGIEGAGVIQAVGEGVARYSAGDRVAFVSSMQPKGGTWAEYAVVDEHSLILPVPDALEFSLAAALPVAANTALRALAALPTLNLGAHRATLPDEPVVFIAGGSGAIGTLAIQIATRRGWCVVASASARNQDYMRSLGARLTVDYRDAEWASQVKRLCPSGVDAAIAVLPGTSCDSMRVVKDGGRVVTVSGDTVAAERGVTVSMVDYQADVCVELLNVIAAAAEGELRIEIERVYSFEEAGVALRKVQTRHARGKVVITLPRAP